MDIMSNGMAYEVASERMADFMREAGKARQVREATRTTSGKTDTQAQEFRPTNAIETLFWAIGRWGRNALPTVR
ncbi:MAG: hypothetical protein ACRC1H_14090 [Caldilineaceae bacterium]